ncbi:hypothetical protein KSS87_007737 [Heliosperma pusillum]|nr:hypothetical protein KSS87_007737 [Heliosperma pusillum]
MGRMIPTTTSICRFNFIINYGLKEPLCLLIIKKFTSSNS